MPPVSPLPASQAPSTARLARTPAPVEARPNPPVLRLRLFLSPPGTRGIVRLRAQRASAEVVPAAEAGTLAIHRVSFTRSCFRCRSHRQHTPTSSIDTRRIRGRPNPASPEKVLVCVEAGEGEIPATPEAVQVALRIVYEGRLPIPSSPPWKTVYDWFRRWRIDGT